MDKTTLREGTDEIVLEETLRDRAEGSRRGEGAVRSGLCRRVRAFAVQPEPARGPQARESRDRVLHEVPRGGQRREGTGDVPETPRGGAPPPPHDRGGDRGAQEAGDLELSPRSTPPRARRFRGAASLPGVRGTPRRRSIRRTSSKTGPPCAAPYRCPRRRRWWWRRSPPGPASSSRFRWRTDRSRTPRAARSRRWSWRPAATP